MTTHKKFPVQGKKATPKNWLTLKTIPLATNRDPELRQKLKRLKGKFRFFSISLLFSYAFISNCITQKTDIINPLINLDNAFSVKKIKKLNDENTDFKFKDPRAYYHFLMALKAQQKWNLNKAIFHFKKVVEYDVESEEFYVFLARLYLMTGQFDRLLELCDQGLERFPHNTTIPLIAADVLSTRGEVQRSLLYLEKGVQENEGPSNTYLLAGLIYLKNKDYYRSQEMLAHLTQVNSTNPLGFHYLGLLHAQLQQWQDAQKALEKSTRLRPSFKKSRELLAWVFEKQGKFEEAESEYSTLLQLSPGLEKYKSNIKRLRSLREGDAGSMAPQPKDSSVHLKLGIMYYEQAKHGEALEELRLYLAEQETPEAKAVHLLIARIFEVYGQYSNAIAEMEVLLNMEPESVEILIHIARMYNLNKNIGRTIDILNRAVELAPKQDELHRSLALAYTSQNHYDPAIKHIRQAIKLNPDRDIYYFDLGSLLERTGAYEEAISSMKQVIELNPNHSNAHNFIGYVYALQGKHLDLAVSHLEKALSVQPQNGYFLDSLGWVYYKKGEHLKALAEIKKALIYTDPDPVLYDHLGDVNYSLANYSEANRAWKISRSLTQTKIKKKQSQGELPDLQSLQDKIRKVQQMLNQSF